MQSGKAMSVLQAQSRRGFAFVDDTTCERLLKLKHKPLPDIDEEDDRKAELAMACMAAINPHMTDVEAADAIHCGFLLENPDDHSAIHVDEDALEDVLNAGEKAKLKEGEARTHKIQSKKALIWATRTKKLPAYFKKAPAPKVSAAMKKPVRWLPKRDETNSKTATDWLESRRPSTVRILCDDYNGRWRVIASNGDWKSISWTKRGFEVAANEALLQAWTYEFDATGRDAPFDLSDVKKTVAPAAASTAASSSG